MYSNKTITKIKTKYNWKTPVMKVTKKKKGLNHIIQFYTFVLNNERAITEICTTVLYFPLIFGSIWMDSFLIIE